MGDLAFWRDRKRQRTAAVQDAIAGIGSQGVATASWSARVLSRFSGQQRVEDRADPGVSGISSITMDCLPSRFKKQQADQKIFLPIIFLHKCISECASWPHAHDRGRRSRNLLRAAIRYFIPRL